MFGIQCLDSYTFHVAFVGNKKQVTDDDTLYFIEIFALYCLYFSFFLSFYSTQCSYKFYTQNVIGPISLLFS